MKVPVHTISSCLNTVESEELKAQVAVELNNATASSGNQPSIADILKK